MVSSIKQTIASGELSAQQKAELEDSLRKIESMSEEERDSLDYFLHHIPENDSDLTLIVLKGHLLIEQRIREFISERMLSPAALDDARLSSYQAICLAEALTLPNAEPKQLWDILRQLNTLRNQMAHNLDPQGVEQRIQKIINDYSQISPVESGLLVYWAMLMGNYLNCVGSRGIRRSA
jgi:hypothetical protein